MMKMNKKGFNHKSQRLYHQNLSLYSKLFITCIIIIITIIIILTSLYSIDTFKTFLSFKTTITSKSNKIPLNCTTQQQQQTCPNYPNNFKSNIISSSNSKTCPDYFKWIHQDLKIWQESKITREILERAEPYAHLRIVIKSGRLYVLKYKDVYETRDVFTIWGILQLLRLYPGQIPDLELLFLCQDRPALWKSDFSKQEQVNITWPPPPLFHYCGHKDAYGIVFPDWSFWGWPEVNIKEWNKLSMALKEGNKKVKWEDRVPYAYWKGNPRVSWRRSSLKRCNFSEKYDPMVHIYAQDWTSEMKTGFKSSNLEDQCTHRYKIYIEGYGWSVSQKYILACDSMSLMIKPDYYDFFGRSLVPFEHYWPIRPHKMCGDLKFAVEWGNNNTKKAKSIGRQGSEYIMKNVEMKYVYDYMLHVFQSYGKLMDMEVKVPENATEVCSESMACPVNDGLIRQCMDDSLVMSPSGKTACDLPKPFEDFELERFAEKQESGEREVEKWTDEYWEVQRFYKSGKLMSNLKLGVEVISAELKLRNQKNRDYQSGHGAINAFVELRFDDQKVKTATKSDDLNPIWNEIFFFDISDSENLSNLILEAYLYNKSTTTTATKSCLGRVRIFGTAFLPYSEALGLHYPLEKEKWSVFSTAAAITGELAMKVFITDNPSLKLPNQNPKIEIPSKPRHKSHKIPKTEKKHTPAKKNPHPKPSQPQTKTPQPEPPQPQSQLSQPQPQVLQAMVAPKRQATRFASATPPAMNYNLNSNPPVNPNLVDYSIKETNPILGRGKQARASGHDLIEPMEFLFVKIVKARDLPRMDPTGSLDPYVEIKLGNFKAKTKQFEKNSNPIWNEVFAFTKSDQQSNSLEVTVMDKDMIRDDFVGTVSFNLMAIPTRIASESPLAPEWYKLEKGGEIMLAIWFGTQTDEAFADAIYSDAFNAINKSSVRSKTYHSPRLWYLRVHVIEAQDLVLLPNRNRFPNVYIKIQLGNQVVRTKLSQNLNPKWNEEFTFVAAEPFEDLIFSIQDQDETLGIHELPIGTIDKRGDDRITVPNRWVNLEKRQSVNGSQRKVRFATKLHLNVSLEGGYHVLDESTYYSSDFRSSMKLNQPSIGALQLGIIGVQGLNLLQEQGKETMDAYCVAKYGQKWVRTRTIMDSFSPRFNEQYTWEVYEPATVLTIGVFDNNQINGGLNKKDGKIGKLRIRISTLESDKIYTNSYPLLVLGPSGVKKMGEIHLAIRFTCTSMIQMLFQYWKPLLPKMHYTRPLKVVQQEILRQHAVNLVAARLSRAEPPLRKEVVEYISDANSHFWSMRKSRANLYRLKSVFSCLFGLGDWFQEICSWRKPMATVAVHVLYLAFVCVPEMILPVMCLCLFMVGLWNYRLRPRQPQEIDTRLSFADNVHVEELNEEFDTFPSSQSLEVIKMRYERLRNIASRAQKVVGDIAGQGERVQALLSWRDPRATSLFMSFCLVCSVVLFAVPFKVFVLLAGLYVMRYPRFRRKTPPGLVNFFRRLPAKTDCML